MNLQDIFVFILVITIIIGFVYMTFIFPKKIEKEDRQVKQAQKEAIQEKTSKK